MLKSDIASKVVEWVLLYRLISWGLKKDEKIETYKGKKKIYTSARSLKNGVDVDWWSRMGANPSLNRRSEAPHVTKF